MSLTIQDILNCVEILTLVFLIIYVVKTWEIASATRKSTEISEKTLLEMKENREQETAPYIVVYCDVPIPYDTKMYIVVKNIGKTIAEDIKINFKPELFTSIKYSDNFNINNLSFIKDGIKSMPPGYIVKTVLDSSESYFENGKAPLKYEVKITYTNSINKNKVESQQIIDLLAIKQLKFVRKYELHDLVEIMKSIDKKIGK